MNGEEGKRDIVLSIVLLFALILGIAFSIDSCFPDPARGATLRLKVAAPTTNVANDSCGFAWTDSGRVRVPGTPLTDLKEILVYGKRFVDPDSSLLGTIPATGAEGDTIGFDLEILDGSMGYVWTMARDISGNKSCRGAEYVFAFPMIDTPTPQPGTGLLGEYYTYDRWTDFKVKLGERVDATVDFDWGAGAAWPGSAADYYSIRWTGTITFPTAGAWTLYVAADNGRRLKIGVPLTLVQDYWTDRSDETVSTGTYPAGPQPIVLEFYEAWGTARAKLSWSGPQRPKEIIPSGALNR